MLFATYLPMIISYAKIMHFSEYSVVFLVVFCVVMVNIFFDPILDKVQVRKLPHKTHSEVYFLLLTPYSLLPIPYSLYSLL